ncbi:peptidylprolyl isomerase [Austwickia sp. TVS 96-490-7B]|uniref:peptidylprolyl isomerase n=1 Tax=Austwickia sp. TVS 96-490-7B TaxID=2830843 RepID=UPI001C55D426|nr:peptidylprolyl isomerase [Austwickia sp. TVS 96-490-7B]
MRIRFARYGAVMCLPLILAACADNSSGSQAGASSAKASGGGAECPAADGSAARRTEFSAAPPMCIDPAKTYTVTMGTDAGDISIELDAKAAPKTVNNFVVLARYHFYDGLTFHRVIPGFVAQGGDPRGSGKGGPGYSFADELPAGGAYQVGSLAMANSGPDTNGSQFFIITGNHGAALPPNYSLFGKVNSGMDIVEKIAKDGTPQGTPTTVHKMTKVTVTEK